jgi:hypothetical protein
VCTTSQTPNVLVDNKIRINVSHSRIVSCGLGTQDHYNDQLTYPEGQEEPPTAPQAYALTNVMTLSALLPLGPVTLPPCLPTPRTMPRDIFQRCISGSIVIGLSHPHILLMGCSTSTPVQVLGEYCEEGIQLSLVLQKKSWKLNLYLC